VTCRDRRSPRGDLLQLADVDVAEGGDALAEQPPQPAERCGLDVLLHEVLVDELGERQRSRR
jgi:hypothetical protein